MRHLLLGAIILSACAPADVPESITSVRFAPAEFPLGVAQSNADLAEDFLDLTLELESGEKLDGLLRYEEPVRVYFRPEDFAGYRDDIEALLARLRREAGVDIAEADRVETAQIVVEMVPRAQMDRIFPTAACFIVPGERSWREFAGKRPEDIVRWGSLAGLGQAAIFLPSDTSPQDVRDCLNEELTQALGPANDLYRTPDSIWNDDNLHSIPTAYNMLMLRVLYQPELRSGMTRAEVAAALPALFHRLNPSGRNLPPRSRSPEDENWSSAIEVALTREAPHAERKGAAQVAAALAGEMEPVDHRLAVSLLALGRLNLRRDPAAAAAQFGAAYNLSRRLHGPDDVRTAHAAVHVAAMALAGGQNALAVQLAVAHQEGARLGQNAVLMAGLRSIEAEALAALGDEPAAREARLDSLRWARYGLGDADGALAREQASLSALPKLDEDQSIP